MAEVTQPDVAHDDLCPICQLLLYMPVRTTCHHLLCKSCMAQWADASSTNNIEHVGLDFAIDLDSNYDPSWLEANCPMCRTRTTAAPDEELARLLQRKYPTLYAERCVEEEIERGSRMAGNGEEGIMLLIGNKHRIERDPDENENQHDWTFFVRTSRPELIKEVRVHLHPTFRPPSLVLRRAPYEVRRLGWGWFTIEAEVVLKEPYSWVTSVTSTRQAALELKWLLDFEGRGRQGRVRAKVRKFEQADVPLTRRRVANQAPVEVADEDDGDHEETHEDDMAEDSSSDEYENEGDSEYVVTPRRR